MSDSHPTANPPALEPTSRPPAPSTPQPQRRMVLVCQNRSCLRSSSDEVLATFQAYSSPTVMVCGSECLGQCGSGPTVKVMPDETWYCQVKPQDVDEIVTQHLQGGNPVQRLLHPRFHTQFSATSFLPPQIPDDL